MNSTMILCFGLLATVCCFSSGNSTDNEGTAAITRLKSRIPPTTADLIRYRKSLVDNTRSRLNDLKIVELTNINLITDPALATIQSTIDQARAAGKSADLCFEPARQRIRLARFNSAKMLDKCATDALATVDPITHSIDILLTMDNLLTAQLDAVPVNCLSSDAMAKQNCITAQIHEMTSNVQAYGNTASLLQHDGDKASSNAEISGQRCYNAVVQTVRAESNGANSRAHQCLANA